MREDALTAAPRGSFQPRVRAALVLVAAACGGACNTITGASGYAPTSACTGPLCSLQCESQGGIWNAAEGACVCADGPLCGGSGGTCCGGTAPHCVTTTAGGERCSPCTEASYECGSICCEQQTCLNAAVEACGTAYGKAEQSCGAGLVCPAPRLDGTLEDADCCESISLPGGTFMMGLEPNGKNRCPSIDVDIMGCTASGDETPAHPVTLSPYRLDRFEVTVARFRRFVQEWDYRGLPAGAGGDARVAGAGWQSAWNTYLPSSRTDLEADLGCANLAGDVSLSYLATWTQNAGAQENLPINCMSWYEAFAFCAWDAGRLPTEAEWEFAAANGDDADLYAWGEAEPTLALAVYDCTTNVQPCEDPPSFFAAVGSLPAGANRWGHRDLAGNVSEWVLDAWAPYPAAAVTNYAFVAPGIRINRGGSLVDASSSLRAASRASTGGFLSSPIVGFRCARSP